MSTEKLKAKLTEEELKAEAAAALKLIEEAEEDALDSSAAPKNSEQEKQQKIAKYLAELRVLENKQAKLEEIKNKALEEIEKGKAKLSRIIGEENTLNEKSPNVAENTETPTGPETENRLGLEKSREKEILQTDEPTFIRSKNIIAGTANKQEGETRDHNEDALYIDTETGVYIIADGMGGENNPLLNSREMSELVINNLLGIATETEIERLVNIANDTSINQQGMLSKFPSISRHQKNPLTALWLGIKRKEDLFKVKGQVAGATFLYANRLNTNEYRIEKAGDTVFFVVNREGEIVEQHGLSEKKNTFGYTASVENGRFVIKKPDTDKFTISLNEGDSLVLATDFIETDAAMKSFIKTNLGNNINFTDFQKEHKADDSTFITIKYETPETTETPETPETTEPTPETTKETQNSGDLEEKKEYSVAFFLKSFPGQMYLKSNSKTFFSPSKTTDASEQVRIIPTSKSDEFLLIPTDNLDALGDLLVDPSFVAGAYTDFAKTSPQNLKIENPNWVITPGLVTRDSNGTYTLTEKIKWAW